ncbi:MAG: dihydrolipoamide acetyltransferase family protein [Dehalococcoidia bacterium]
MAIEVTMPQMGADMTEGTLVRWLKQVGDQVKRGEILAEIETDKATVELEAFESGTVQQLVVGEGETVPVGQVIALFAAPGEAIAAAPEPPRLQRTEAGERKLEGVPAERPAARATDSASAVSDGRLRISPVARRIASEAGLDIHAVKGSGPDGRVLRRDVEDALASAAAPAPAAVVAPSVAAPAVAPTPPKAPPAAQPAHAPVVRAEGTSKMRQAIARRMTQSKQNQPHYYLTLDVDMTEALAFRERVNASASEAQRVSINDLVVKACALALGRHPRFNAEFDNGNIKYHDEINICIGIALDDGLIAPAILHCDEKTLGKIAADAKDLVSRAKTGHLRAEEYAGGTFTITNLGAYGVESLIGIINPPQAAILGVGSVMPKPVVRDGEIVARSIMKVALSADHRVTDGAEGARFIKEIQGILENPASMAL